MCWTATRFFGLWVEPKKKTLKDHNFCSILVSKLLFFWLKKRLKVCQTFKKHLGIQQHMNRPKIVNSKTASKFWNNQKVTRLLFLISLWCSVQQNRKCTWQYYTKVSWPFTIWHDTNIENPSCKLHCKCLVCWIHRWMSNTILTQLNSSNFNRLESLTKIFCFHHW